LGSRLVLKSQAEKKPPIGISVDWAQFEHGGKDLDQIEINLLDEVAFIVPRPSVWNEKAREFGPRPDPRPNSRSVTGTELLITELRQNWAADDIQRLRDELSQLNNPFDPGTDFQLRTINDVDKSLDGVLVSSGTMDGEIEGEFVFDGEEVVITFQSRQGKLREQRPTKESIDLNEFLGLPPVEKGDSPRNSIGPVKVRIRLYSLGEGLTSKATKSLLADFLARNAGVRVYRDGVRVLPYGDPQKPEGDWLELAQRKAGGRAAVTRADWRIEPSRIVGAVTIGRDANPGLHDASGREGLIANDEFATLRLMVLMGIRHMEIAYHKIRSAPFAAKEAVTQPRKVVRFFKTYAKELREDLKELEKKLPKAEEGKIEKVRAKIELQEKRSAELGASLAEILDRSLTYRGLATLGIAHASFGHEIQMSAGQFVDAAHAALLELNPPPNIPSARAELEKAIKHGGRISTWGSYTLTRVKAAKRVANNEPLSKLIEKLIEDIEPFFDSSSVSLKAEKLDAIDDMIVPMDMESLIINLLTNAYDFVKNSGRLPRKVRVNLKKKSREGIEGYEITVGDSGPGVPKHIRDDIWRPLFTTKKGPDKKPNGTGLGLSIVDDVVRDLGGHREVGTDPELGGALFTIWLPKHST
jgi:hypothetical protein